jgi:hypothetical protein
MIEGQPPRAERRTGLSPRQLADLIGRVREVVGPWENPPIGRPHALPLPAAVVAVLFGLRHNMPDDVLGEVFGCSQASITGHHEILQPILRWVTRPEVDQQLASVQRAGVLVDGLVAPAGERDSYHGLFSGRNTSPGNRRRPSTAEAVRGRSVAVAGCGRA